VNQSVFQGFPDGLPLAEDTASATCTKTIPLCFPEPMDGAKPWLRVSGACAE
jgi:hypothetical protein